jgi:hypothetical protein
MVSSAFSLNEAKLNFFMVSLLEGENECMHLTIDCRCCIVHCSGAGTMLHRYSFGRGPGFYGSEVKDSFPIYFRQMIFPAVPYVLSL